ncbi:MAG: ABC transporter permease [Eubacteriales bacterium]|nr:ABC transporter permease [Eubacteriales bacterium]
MKKYWGLLKPRLDTLSRLTALAIIFLSLVIVSPSFASAANIINVLRITSLTLMMAIGVALCMLVGGIDLSIGATIALTSILFGKFFQVGQSTASMIMGITGMLAVSILIGLVNGFCIVFLHLPPFLATFGVQQIVRGLAYLLTSGLVYSNFTEDFRFIGGGQLFGIPMPIIIAVILLLIISFTLNKTTFGYRVYAVGSNRESARYSGIPVNKTLITTYVLSSLIAGIAGIVYTSRLNAAEPTIGAEFAQTAIAAAAIGGISFRGGNGNVLGVVIGALILTLVSNGMTLLGVDSNWQVGISGVVIILSVLVDRNASVRKT